VSSIAVVTAGLSMPSSTRVLGDQLAAAVSTELAVDGSGVEVRVFELREHAHAVIDSMLTGFPPPQLQDVIDTVTHADGLIVVTPIFKASYSGLFKSFFDILDKEALRGKPVLIGATGGTERHSLVLDHALRPLFGYLQAYIVPTAVYASSADFGAPGLSERVQRAAREFAMLIRSLGPSVPPDPFGDVVSFDKLLDSGA
jgi:FMN reductase